VCAPGNGLIVIGSSGRDGPIWAGRSSQLVYYSIVYGMSTLPEEDLGRFEQGLKDASMKCV
jgi:hypothetical protein